MFACRHFDFHKSTIWFCNDKEWDFLIPAYHIDILHKRIDYISMRLPDVTTLNYWLMGLSINIYPILIFFKKHFNSFHIHFSNISKIPSSLRGSSSWKT